MRYIDIHAHCYRFPLPFVTRFCNPQELLERYDAHGIEMGALLPVVNSEIYLPQANEDILEMVENHPDRFFPFCNVDPRALINRADAPLDAVLSYYKEKGCKGVGEIMPNLPFEDERVQNLFRCAELVGLPVTTDGSDRPTGDFGLCDQPGLPGLEHTLQRFPNLQFIAHGPIFWAEYTSRPRPAPCKPGQRPAKRVARTPGAGGGRGCRPATVPRLSQPVWGTLRRLRSVKARRRLRRAVPHRIPGQAFLRIGQLQHRSDLRDEALVRRPPRVWTAPNRRLAENLPQQRHPILPSSPDTCLTLFIDNHNPTRHNES